MGVALGQGAEGETSVAPGPADLLVAGLRAVEYAALLFLAGGLLLGRLGRRGGQGWVRPNLRAAAGLALLAGVGVVAGEASLAAPSPSVGMVAAFLGAGLAGGARVARVAAEAALALVVARGRRGAGTLLAIAFLALAAAGHAAAVRPRLAGIAVDALHLGSAGVWGGAILALGTLRPPGGWRSGEGRALLDRFSPIALWAFGVTVATGVLRGAQELAALDDLVTTSYGLVLLAKVALVAVMTQLSALAWRRLSGSLRAEAVVAVLVVGAAALLAAYPLPPARLAEAVGAAERSRASGASALPRPGDLTMGGDAGQVLVGLTIRPGRPGINDVLVFLLPLEGEEAAAGLPAGLRVGRRSLPLEDCGPTCRRAATKLRGGERLVVEVGTGIGGEASFSLPDLPAADGAALLDAAEQRMRALRTYRVEEALSSGLGATVRSSYAFRAPDQMRLSVRGGATIVRIGDIQYAREGRGGTWEVEDAPRLSVPLFIWDSFLPPVAPRVVGSGRIDGRSVQVVSFFGSGDLPVWFRLWIDDEGLVRRAEMRAQGHFMDQRYHAFDSRISIQRPGSGAPRTDALAKPRSGPAGEEGREG